MGTNYYYYHSKPCRECGRDFESMHIGKSSGGWVFSLHVEPDDPDFPQSLDDWKKRFFMSGTRIQDEYGKVITVPVMLSIIEDRSWDTDKLVDAQWYRENHAEPGPKGLARHKISAEGHCIAHGEGTWDLITGDFS
jgi:hypothetical protein